MITWLKRNRDVYKTFTSRQKIWVAVSMIGVAFLLGTGVYLVGYMPRSQPECAIAGACYGFILGLSGNAAIALVARLDTSDRVKNKCFWHAAGVIGNE